LTRLSCGIFGMILFCSGLKAADAGADPGKILGSSCVELITALFRVTGIYLPRVPKLPVLKLNDPIHGLLHQLTNEEKLRSLSHEDAEKIISVLDGSINPYIPELNELRRTIDQVQTPLNISPTQAARLSKLNAAIVRAQKNSVEFYYREALLAPGFDELSDAVSFLRTATGDIATVEEASQALWLLAKSLRDWTKNDKRVRPFLFAQLQSHYAELHQMKTRLKDDRAQKAI